ncbi:hypothetical protein [Cysteiniphilum halobium]|uniref:hypothetical protein n=1 Tax=Cysteiniphilum halobium TaxID=2219059 RepID=UPI003F878739
MRVCCVFLILLMALLISGCGLFPAPIVTGKIPPSLTQPRIVYGCSHIHNELKLATCYLKAREALYLANQDKKSLKTLDDEWND